MSREIGRRLRDARRRLDLTQADVGQSLGVPRATISNWEVGRAAPSPEHLAALSTILQTPVDELLGVERSDDLLKEHREPYETPSGDPALANLARLPPHLRTALLRIADGFAAILAELIKLR